MLNVISISLSYLLSNAVRRAFHCGMPMSISIEPVNYCNLSCSECPTGNKSLIRKPKAIDYSLYVDIINEVAPYLCNLFLYFQGEPFLHKDITNMIAYAHTHNIYTVISTNANTLTASDVKAVVASGLDKLIISFDGVDNATYQKYRKGGDLNKVIQTVTEFVKQKKESKQKHPIIELQFLVFSFNEHQEKDVITMGRQLNADIVTLKSAQIYDYNKKQNAIPQHSKTKRYVKNKNGTYSIKKKIKNRCWRLWNSSVITAEGELVPCCFDKNAAHSFGNLKNNTFKTVWKNDAVRKFRQLLLENRTKIAICRNCNS